MEKQRQTSQPNVIAAVLEFWRQKRRGARREKAATTADQMRDLGRQSGQTPQENQPTPSPAKRR
ncbi:MAG TPA: hypothetical protein VLB73_00115 [Patescibacteria group bacterium]|nr:hypothetical protein [Patescibacteria group bacterium]